LIILRCSFLPVFSSANLLFLLLFASQGIETFGHGDEEKRACGLRHLSKDNLVDSQCVIFSVGSANQWDFEEMIFKELPNCKVETFDCTISDKTLPPEPIRSRVRFHPVCIGDADYLIEGRQYLSWESILKRIGLSSSPTFLKMDIEGYEFPVLTSIVNSGIHLPLQIAMEIHQVRLEHGQWQNSRLPSTLELYSWIEMIYKFGGYYLVDRHDNPYCVTCSEVLLAKLDCHNYPIDKQAKQWLYDKQTNELWRTSLNHTLSSKYWDG
jgi:hypothetical protein